MSSSEGFAPWRANTLDKYIQKGKELGSSHERLQLKTELRDEVIIPYRGIVTKYMSSLKNHIHIVKLTDAQLQYYQYSPKLFCYERYGTPELWSELLYINHMTTIMEFNKQTIRAFTSNINDYIAELVMLYRDDLIENRSNIEEVYN